MPDPASSSANDLVNISNPALDIQYDNNPGYGLFPYFIKKINKFYINLKFIFNIFYLYINNVFFSLLSIY